MNTYSFTANKLLAGYVALRALGIHANFVDILLVQTLVMFLLYFAPTPGASGIGEVLSAAVMSLLRAAGAHPDLHPGLATHPQLLHASPSASWSSPAGCGRGLKGDRGRGAVPEPAGWPSRCDERRGRRRSTGLRRRRCCGACWSTSGPTAGWRSLAVLLLLAQARPGAGRARASPSARSTWPSRTRDVGLLGTLAALFLAALLLEFVAEYGADAAHHATSASG